MLGAAVLPAFTVSIEGVLATLLPPDRVEISSSLLGIGLQLPQAIPANLLTCPPQLTQIPTAALSLTHRSCRPMPANLAAFLPADS